MIKKLLLPLLVCPLLLTACSSDEPALKENRPSELNKRTESEMIEYAVSAYTKLNDVQSRAGVNYGKLNKIGAVNGSRSGEDDYSLYSLDFGEDEGYVIVTDCDRVPPVFAVVETGCFEDNDENSPVNYYLDLARNYIKEQTSGLAGGIEPSNPGYQYREEVIDTTGYKIVNPQLKVWWGQTGTYNKYIPYNLPTGCGPTALGMALSYVEYPSIQIDFDGRHENLTLKWSDLRKHNFEKLNCSEYGYLGICMASDEVHDNIAKLLRQLGELSNTKYIFGSSTSSTVVQDLIDAMSFLKIDKGPFTYYYSGYGPINDDNILLMFGMSGTDPRYSNHVFIADGINYLSYDIIENIYEELPFTTPTGEKARKLISSTVVASHTSSLVHIVWGYDNTAVGYFNDNVFNPSKPVIPDMVAGEYTGDVWYSTVAYVKVNASKFSQSN